MNEWQAQDAKATASLSGTEDSRPLLLSQARESAGLHIEALAAALKVPVKKLEALEAGRYAELPDMIFARALASSACRQLKVDPAPILAQIPAGVTPQLGGSGMAINATFKSASGAAPASPVGWLSRPAVLVAILLMLGALVLVFLPEKLTEKALAPQTMLDAPGAGNVTNESQVSSLLVTPSDTTSTVVLSAPGSMPAAGLTAGEALSPSLGSVPPTVAVPATSQITTPVLAAATVAAGAEPVASGSLLSIRTTGESWLKVTNGTGSVEMQRMLRPGEQVEFSAAPPYAVVLGRADSAEVLVRGRVFDTAPFALNGVARFEVK